MAEKGGDVGLNGEWEGVGFVALAVNKNVYGWGQVWGGFGGVALKNFLFPFLESRAGNRRVCIIFIFINDWWDWSTACREKHRSGSLSYLSVLVLVLVLVPWQTF